MTDLAASVSGPGSTGSTSSPGNAGNHFPLGMVMIIVVAGVMVAALVVLKRGGGKGPDYDKKEQPKDDWSKYYEKK